MECDHAQGDKLQGFFIRDAAAQDHDKPEYRAIITGFEIYNQNQGASIGVAATSCNQNQLREGPPYIDDDAIYNPNQQREGVYCAIDNQNQQEEGAYIGDYAVDNQYQPKEEIFNLQIINREEGAYIGDNAVHNQNQQRNGAFNHQRGGDYEAICDQNQQRNGDFREGGLNHSNFDGAGGDFVERLSIDEVLRKWVGEFGRAQIVHFTLTSLAWSLEALHTLVTIFADKTPPWRCINNNKNIINNHIHTAFNASFNNYHGSNFQYNGSNYADCTPSSSLCGLAPGLWEWVRKNESTVSEWNLVCQSSYMQGLAQSFFFIGCLLGAGLCGHLSDSRLGRRGALVLTCMLNAVCGMLTAASPNYGVYTLLRAATGICSGGLGLTSFVLGTESIGPSCRTSAAMSALYFYPLGVLLLAGLAASTSQYSWRILYLVTSTPSVLYCLFILPFLAESPRWYLVRGRTHEALQVLKNIAKKNGTIVPAGIVLFVEDQADDNDDKCKYDHHLHDADNMKAIMPLQQHLSQDGLAAHAGSEMQQLDIALPCLQAETRLGIRTLCTQLPIQTGSELREVKESAPMPNGLELRGYDKSREHLSLKNESEQHTINTMPLHPPIIDAGEDPGKAHIETGLELREMTTSPPFCQPVEINESNHPIIADGLEFKEINSKKKLANVTNAQKVNGKAASGTLMDVFRSTDTRIRMVILVVVWFASALGYYAFNLNVGNLGTNLTMSVVLNALAEVPGYAVATYMRHRVGHRITLISALLLTGCSSLMSAIMSYKLSPHTLASTYRAPLEPPYSTINVAQSTLPLHVLASYNTTITTHHYPIQVHLKSKAQGLRSFIQLICSLVGLSSIAGTYNLLYLYTAELFPTVVRNVALGLANQAGAIGSIIAPFVVLSAHVNTTLPFFIIGVTSLLSGVMSFKLPETLNHPFHETLEGMQRAKDEA